ncbi:MAG: DUF1565 domain-containing protein, partial [Candidatus Zipacnadales bacterium]
MMLGISVGWVALTVVAAAAEYAVSPKGNDDNPGTVERPWQTLAKANAVLQPGDTITLLEGSYPGVIEPQNSGEEGEPITYRANSSHSATITGGQSSDGLWTCVRLKDRDHIIIEGLQ